TTPGYRTRLATFDLQPSTSFPEAHGTTRHRTRSEVRPGRRAHAGRTRHPGRVPRLAGGGAARRDAAQHLLRHARWPARSEEVLLAPAHPRRWRGRCRVDLQARTRAGARWRGPATRGERPPAGAEDRPAPRQVRAGRASVADRGRAAAPAPLRPADDP